jgi:hypothetical protein
MVFNTTFNNISVKSWRSVLLVEETGVNGENHHKALEIYHIMLHQVHLTRVGFKQCCCSVFGVFKSTLTLSLRYKLKM